VKTQRILLGDCLDVLSDQRDVKAFVFDPPGLVGYGGFIGRKWDTAHEKSGKFVPMLPTRGKQHASELEKDHDFTLYWAIRFSMAYDIAAKDAVIVLWTLPRTSHLMANALRAAGWTIKENLIHLFGTGWMKANRTTEDGERVPNAFAPGYENWILATKGKPDLDIDACRVPRGAGEAGTRCSFYPNRCEGHGASNAQSGPTIHPWPPKEVNGSLPKNALLSHCEECCRVGTKRVRTGIAVMRNVAGQDMPHRVYGDRKYPDQDMGYAENGTEFVPAWHCLAGCVCGARSKWDPENPLPRCPCGEVWRWLCAVAEVTAQSGNRPSGSGQKSNRTVQSCMSVGLRPDAKNWDGSAGGAARFFNTFQYLSKCSSSERHAGCESLYWRANKKNLFGYDQITREEWEALPVDKRAQGNTHATVKSIRQMLWFHAVTSADKIVDLTAGSCSGALAAHLADVEWIGAEVCPEAIVIGKARLAWWSALSAEAKRAMLEDDVVPTPAKTNELQTSLNLR
jgi:hypothetical protein